VALECRGEETAVAGMLGGRHTRDRERGTPGLRGLFFGLMLAGWP